MEQTATNAIYKEKFDRPVVEFPQDFEKRLEDYKRYVKEGGDDPREDQSIANMFEDVMNKAHVMTDKEITIPEMEAVIKDNVEKLKEINGALEDFKKRDFSTSAVLPQETKEEDWQFTEFSRYYKDFLDKNTHWREADAITSAFAFQLFKKIGYDGIKRLFAQLDVQRDKIEEQLEMTCELKNSVSELSEQFLIAAVPVDEQSQRELAKMAGANEKQQEAIVSILNKMTGTQRILEEMLYINYEQTCLLGKAKEWGSPEEKSKDYEEYDQKTAKGETYESVLEKEAQKVNEALAESDSAFAKYIREIKARAEKEQAEKA